MSAIVSIYLASAVYAVIRYVAFAPKNAESIPVFILNKGISMAAAICLAAGFLQAWRRDRGRAVSVEPSAWFRAGTFGAIWHIPMSLVVLRPEYFKEFFRPPDAPMAGRLSFEGEMVFLLGGATAALLFLLTRPQWSGAVRRRISIAAMVTLLGHILSMGYCRGLNINASHAYLPPMWLLSVVAAALGLWWLVRSRGDERCPPP